MKKLFILTVLLSCFVLQKADAYPVYSDELPQSYINSVKTNKNLGNKQSLPVYDTQNMLEVNVYTPNRITLNNVLKKTAKGEYYTVQNYDINDRINFIVGEDVYKNNKLYIKKGTIAVGIVREAQIGFGQFTAPDEIHISMFTTKDVNNNDVKLYGNIIQEGKQTGLFQVILQEIPSLRASIPKNKLYTLYCK